MASVVGEVRQCAVCGAALTGLQSLYCRLACKMRAWWRTHQKPREPEWRTLYRACPDCGQYRLPENRFCATCRVRRKYQYGKCRQCGNPLRSGQINCCSSVCRAAHLRGKKYRPRRVYERRCMRCSRTFTTQQKQIVMCRWCKRALLPFRDHGKAERRAKRAGVPYTHGIQPEKVFARDGWRCHLCGCRTPKHLRGKNRPRSPEVDHIVPISAGGGHIWENVACACRQCNMKKQAKPLGQLRLA